MSPEEILKDKISEAKRTAFWQTVYSAWLLTRFELDKTLITLSSAGIGLVVTIVGLKTNVSCYEIRLLGLTSFFFLSSILIALLIFFLNTGYVDRIIKGGEPDSMPLEFLDIGLGICFILGVLSFVCFGIMIGLASIDLRIKT